jgi:hypothetical protein
MAMLGSIGGIRVAGSQPAPPPQSTISMPEPEVLLYLIRSHILALHHANITGNYTVLRDLGSPAFRAANSAARLGAIFANLRDAGVDLGAAATVTAELIQAPAISQGLLTLVGNLALPRQPVRFELGFQPVEQTWQLFAITIVPLQAQAAAPADPPPRSQKAAPKADPKSK